MANGLSLCPPSSLTPINTPSQPPDTHPSRAPRFRKSPKNSHPPLANPKNPPNFALAFGNETASQEAQVKEAQAH